MHSKIIDRVRKLLALASNAGATEGEASNAAAMAAALMEQHGLAAATVAAAGGSDDERRGKEEMRGGAAFNWQPGLMAAVAESCFVDVRVLEKRAPRGRPIRVGYSLLGREAHVAGAKVLYEYLCQAVERLSREAQPARPKFYKVGVADRLAHRLRQRHQRTLREQREAAERAAAEAATCAARAGGNATSATALVVTLVDYAQREADLNADVREGLPAGTTADRRAKRDAAAAAKAARERELVAQGVNPGVAFNMARLGMSRQRAEEYEAEWLANQAAAAAAGAGRQHKPRRTWRDDAYESGSYHRGLEDGEAVGLDQQVGADATRRIGKD
jgi:hypothetical protein